MVSSAEPTANHTTPLPTFTPSPSEGGEKTVEVIKLSNAPAEPMKPLDGSKSDSNTDSGDSKESSTEAPSKEVEPPASEPAPTSTPANKTAKK